MSDLKRFRRRGKVAAVPRHHPALRGIILAVLIAALLAAYFGLRDFRTIGAASRVAKDAAHDAATYPVTVSKVSTADFPVNLNGLGTVQPYDTVTVRSRVDGEVTKVSFRQGQMVKEGDLLVQIDPRPYQAVLDQALARKAQDEANLNNALVMIEVGNVLLNVRGAPPLWGWGVWRRPRWCGTGTCELQRGRFVVYKM